MQGIFIRKSFSDARILYPYKYLVMNWQSHTSDLKQDTQEQCHLFKPLLNLFIIEYLYTKFVENCLLQKSSGGVAYGSQSRCHENSWVGKKFTPIRDIICCTTCLACPLNLSIVHLLSDISNWGVIIQSPPPKEKGTRGGALLDHPPVRNITQQVHYA